MKTRVLLLLFASILLASSQICNSTTFWNPLNNACVNRTSRIIKNAHGYPLTSTMPTLPLANA